MKRNLNNNSKTEESDNWKQIFDDLNSEHFEFVNQQIINKFY